MGDRYNSFLDCEELTPSQMNNGDVVIHRNGSLVRPKRLASGLFQFKENTGEDRCVMDCINSLQNGADLIWIETEKPHVGQIGGMVNRIREVVLREYDLPCHQFDPRVVFRFQSKLGQHHFVGC